MCFPINFYLKYFFSCEIKVNDACLQFKCTNHLLSKKVSQEENVKASITIVLSISIWKFLLLN